MLYKNRIFSLILLLSTLFVITQSCKEEVEVTEQKMYSLDFSNFVVNHLNGKYGVVNEYGRVVIPYVYDDINKIKNSNVIKVKKGDNYYLIDTLGNQFLLAEKIEDINKQTEAVSLSEPIEELPREVFKYKNIKILILSGLKIESIPEQIKKLKKLMYLNVSKNRLTELPEAIGELPNLQKLYISYNKIKKLPNSFSKLKQLNFLEAADNQIEELPSDFGKLNHLEQLYLSYNRLEQLPESCKQLQKLQGLYLSFNSLKALPEFIGSLGRLKVLSVQNNRLEQLPESIGQLKTLEQLHLDNNQLNTLPKSIGLLKSLKKLSILNNKIDEFPSSFWELGPQLTLDIYYRNQIEKFTPLIYKVVEKERSEIKVERESVNIYSKGNGFVMHEYCYGYENQQYESYHRSLFVFDTSSYPPKIKEQYINLISCTTDNSTMLHLHCRSAKDLHPVYIGKDKLGIITRKYVQLHGDMGPIEHHYIELSGIENNNLKSIPIDLGISSYGVDYEYPYYESTYKFIEDDKAYYNIEVTKVTTESENKVKKEILHYSYRNGEYVLKK